MCIQRNKSMQEERKKEKTLHLTTALLKIMKKMQPNDLI